jgi:hypothetical protein
MGLRPGGLTGVPRECSKPLRECGESRSGQSWVGEVRGGGTHCESGAGRSVVAGQGSLGAIVEVLGVPHGAVFFQELENLFQDHLGVGGEAYVLFLEAGADNFGGSVLKIQDFLQCMGPAFR